LKLALKYRRYLFSEGERTPLESVLAVTGLVIFAGLFIASIVGAPTVQWIEVMWSAIAIYGLTFDVLNMLNVRRDKALAVENLDGLDPFRVIFWEAQLSSAKKRVVGLSMLLGIGLFAMLASPSKQAPNARVGSIVLQVMLFIFAYCVASNAQDDWVNRRRLADVADAVDASGKHASEVGGRREKDVSVDLPEDDGHGGTDGVPRSAGV
jgi:amino acid transporter